ncbi:MAG: glycosyltransferase [Muribaculaceae bacterium]|nr:glycosyltransferase [Muribaculaceae bacterium]
MIWILLDTVEGYPFIEQRLTMPCRKILSPQKKSKYHTWIAGAWQASRQSKKGDTILAVYDFQGILCWIFGVLTMRRRNVLSINLLLKDKDTMRNKVATWLYRRAIHSPRFATTVTSGAYSAWINRKLGTKIDFPLLRDVYYLTYEPATTPSKGDGSVFCGGRNSRDWPLMIEVAKRLPEVKFRFAMPLDSYHALKDSMPSNVEAAGEIPYDQFMEWINCSSVICMPLTTDAPAGLITMFQAAGYRKPIVASYTVTSSEYLTPEHGYLLKSSEPEKWSAAISEIMADYEKALKKAETFHHYVSTQCSEQYYVSRIEEIIRTLGWA